MEENALSKYFQKFGSNTQPKPVSEIVCLIRWPVNKTEYPVRHCAQS